MPNWSNSGLRISYFLMFLPMAGNWTHTQWRDDVTQLCSSTNPEPACCSLWSEGAIKRNVHHVKRQSLGFDLLLWQNPCQKTIFMYRNSRCCCQRESAQMTQAMYLMRVVKEGQLWLVGGQLVVCHGPRPSRSILLPYDHPVWHSDRLKKTKLLCSLTVILVVCCMPW